MVDLDLSLASLVRASSGALMALFGAYLLTVRPATTRSRALGAYHLALGPVFVFTNLLGADLGALAVVFRSSVALFIAAAAALVWLSWHETREHRGARVAFAAFFLVALACGVASALLVGSAMGSGFGEGASAEAKAALDDAYDDGRRFYAALDAAGVATVFVLALLFRASAEAVERRRFALLAAGLAIYPVFDKGSTILSEPAASADAWVALPAYAVAALAWALAARGPASSSARNASLAIIASALAALATAFWITTDVWGDDIGLIGVARLTGIALLAFAIFRLDLLGVGFTARTIRRGTLATVGLASLLIVAQVAQNFFSAEYGLLMGGVVAGALLFAASPLQRAAERLTGADLAPVTRVIEVARDDRREDVYRKALRLALKDAKLSREEETHLHELADELGISGPRAHALLAEVEREARGLEKKEVPR